MPPCRRTTPRNFLNILHQLDILFKGASDRPLPGECPACSTVSQSRLTGLHVTRVKSMMTGIHYLVSPQRTMVPIEPPGVLNIIPRIRHPVHPRIHSEDSICSPTAWIRVTTTALRIVANPHHSRRSLSSHRWRLDLKFASIMALSGLVRSQQARKWHSIPSLSF